MIRIDTDDGPIVLDQSYILAYWWAANTTVVIFKNDREFKIADPTKKTFDHLELWRVGI